MTGPMKPALILGLLSLAFNTSAWADRPIKNVTITTPEDHSQPLAPANHENTSWEKPSARLYPNVQAGRWITSGSFELYQTWVGYTDYFVLNLGTSLERFLTDRWSLGGSLGLTHYSDTTDVSMGPSSTYYFYLEDRVGAYFNTKLTYDFTDQFDDMLRWKNGVGMRYFMTPAVALGPEVFFNHGFGMGNRRDYNQFGMLATFALHL